MLEARRMHTSGTRTTHGRLRERTIIHHTTIHILHPRHHLLTPPRMAATIHPDTSGPRLQADGQQQPRIPHQRGTDDSHRDTNIGTGTNTAKPRNTATHTPARPIPMRRRGRLCRRNSVGSHRRRTMRRVPGCTNEIRQN